MTPGTVVAGRYRIERLLGRGGMGAVYRAVDLQTHRARALKLMLDHKVEDADARERFAREAGIAGRIDSPFVVDVLDTGVDADHGTPYIVMELLEGENLERRLARLGPRPAAEVVEDLAQVARALQRMHARSVIHRDLKPSNLFREERAGLPPRIKVLDLGVAKIVSMTGGGTTAIVGSVPYMAPEQIQGGPLGPPTDLYALGLIAYALLTGRSYWSQAPDEQAIAFALRIVAGAPDAASVRARGSGVELPAAFDAWFERATARSPEARFPSAADAITALGDALGAPVAPWADDPAEDPAYTDDITTAGERAHGDRAPPATDGSSAADARSRPAPGATESASGELGLAPTAADGAAPPRPPTPRARTRRRRRWAIAATAAIAAAAVALIAAPRLRGTPAASPLDPPGAVLACPLLAVDGDARDRGWLGAAAGSLACERARVLLGGLPARTRIPAELLDLREVTTLAEDPYAAADARDRSLAAAARSDAYLDGRVTALGAGALGAGFRVELALRTPDGAVHGRGTGEGSALFEAVRAAMDGLGGALPTAAAPDPSVADFSRGRDIPTLLRLLDWSLALANQTAALKPACAWFAEPGGDAATDLAPFVRHICASTRGAAEPTIVLPTGDSAGARTARARVAFLVHGEGDDAIRATLRALFDAEPSTWGRSTIAATLSCLHQRVAPDEALTWAWRAVGEPKNPTGEWCAPWAQLMSMAGDTPVKERAAAQWSVWAPWDAYAWWYTARLTTADEPALGYARRAYRLSPFDTNIAGDLANRLLHAGDAAGVEQIATQLGASDLPVHQALGQLLQVRSSASAAKFGRAVEAAGAALRSGRGGPGWIRSLRIEHGWRAVEIANVLGRAGELADLAVRELVDPDPPPDLSGPDTASYIAAICAYAPAATAERCFARLASLAKPTPFAAGARRFAAGDLRGAADAWRSVVADARGQVALLGEAMVRAFAAAGELELAIRVGEQASAEGARFHRANLAMVRTAEAFAARGKAGDADRARDLAARVADAWLVADVRPPVYAAMHRLAGR